MTEEQLTSRSDNLMSSPELGELRMPLITGEGYTCMLGSSTEVEGSIGDTFDPADN
jgi:hypothetical protein